MASFVLTRTVLKDIGIGAIVDGQWLVQSYSHTGTNAFAVKCDKAGKITAPFTRVLLIHTDNEPIVEKRA